MADIVGDNDPNTLPGTPNDDTITGLGGNDTLQGQDGNDTLNGGAGSDTLDGGNGTDTATYADSSEGVTGNVFTVQTLSGSETDTLISIENLIGSNFNDQLVGGAGANTLEGLGGEDILIGQNGDDILRGGDGHDILRGRNDNDSLYGDAGDDFLQGGEGNDLMDGGDGNDRANFFLSLATDAQVGATVDLTIQGVAQNTGHGMDTLVSIEHVSGTTFADTFTGNAGANWLWGQGGGDTLSGGDGNDLIEIGSTGSNIVSGGNGTDTLSFFNNNDFTSGVVASLLLQGASQAIAGGGSFTATGFENLSGSTFNDTLTGDAGNNILAGAEGADDLSGGDGNDTLYGDGIIWMYNSLSGGSGPITTTPDLVALNIGAVAGNDTLRGGAGTDILEGGSGDDLLLGGLGNDTIRGGDGIDTVSYEDISVVNGIGVGVYLLRAENVNRSQGDGGGDIITGVENVIGSQISDTLDGDHGNNVLTGLGGDDLLIGEGGDDTLHGGAGEDFLRGRDGNDIAYGGADNDFFSGGEGNDLMDGGDGFDRASMFLSLGTDIQAGATVDLAITTAQDTGHGLDTFINIEHVSGTTFSDTFYGNSGDNWLWGTSGGDYLDGRDGNDLLESGIGANTFIGGNGVDTVRLFDNTSPPLNVTINLNLQGAAQDTGQGLMTLSGIENVTGTTGDDTLIGDSANNTLAGAQGADILQGGDGADLLLGDGDIRMLSTQGGSGPITVIENLATQFSNPAYIGNDVLDGGAGNDRLVGAGGDDLLSGGTGNNTLEGGDGEDRAVYTAATEAVTVILNTGGNGFASTEGGSLNDTLSSIEAVEGSDFGDFIRGSAGNEKLYGGAGQDTVRGESGDDTVRGGDDDDFVRGGNGADLVYGDDGNDYVHGGEGDDTIDGGAGADRVAFSLQPSEVQVGATIDLNIQGVAQDTGHGMDTLIGIEHASGTIYNDTIDGNADANWLWGQDGDDVLLGNEGDDLLEVGTGDHTVDGGVDNDTLIFSIQGETPTNITFSLALQGSEQAFGAGTLIASGIENLSGRAGDDFLTGDDQDNIIAGGSGGDTLEGGEGADLLLGDGIFGISGTAGFSGEILYEEDNAAAENNPALSGDDLMFGGDGNDRIVGGAGLDELHGDAGDDTLEAGAGNDIIDGGADFDTAVFTGALADYVTFLQDGELYITDLRVGSPDGTDHLISIELAQFSDGTRTAEDLAQTAPGTNTDILQTTIGIASSIDASLLLLNDEFAADDLSPTVTAVSGGDGVTVSLVDGKLVIVASSVSGGTFNYTVTGAFGSSQGQVNVLPVSTNASPNVVSPSISASVVAVDFQGQGGNDTLTGTSNADHLVGGAGNDILNGGAGADVMEGGTNNDTYEVDAAGDLVVELANEGDDLVLAGIDYTLTDNVERLTLTGAAINGTGNALVNTLTGNDQNNILDGGAGIDTLRGGLGNDIFIVDHQDEVVSDTGGVDTVQTALNSYYLVATTIENLTFTGTGNFHGIGTSLANVLTGGAGDDILFGGAGGDTLIGGDGNDTLYVAQGTDVTVETLTGGIDTVVTDINWTLGENIEILRGDGLSAFNLTGNELNNEIYGNAANNVINGGLGADRMEGAAGNDTYVVDDIGDVVVEVAAGGTDTINTTIDFTLADEVEKLVLLGSAISGMGNSAANTLVGNTLNNILDGAGGADILQGGLGNDTYYVDDSGDVVTEAGIGIDTVIVSGLSAYTLAANVENMTFSGATTFTANGNTLANVLTGGTGNDVLNGNEGDDTLHGGGGEDSLKGGAGNDTYYVDSAGDTISDVGGGIDTIVTNLNSYTIASSVFENLTFNGTGDFVGTGTSLANVITGGAGNDTLSGLAGDDTLNGGLGDDSLFGGQGNDTLNGGDGSDTLTGEAGNDTYNVTDVGDVVVEALNGGTDRVISLLNSYTLTDHVENLTFGDIGAVTGIGNGLANSITGGTGDDLLEGRVGDDKLFGGLGADDLLGNEGNDTLDGQGGDDYAAGGIGNDTYVIDSLGDVVVELVGEGTTDTVKTALSSLTLADNVEIMLFTGAGGFTGTGNALGNTINGGAGDDTLNGAAGADTLRGGLGLDTLNGGDDNDKLYGEGGDDALNGGNGADYLYGGAGTDALTGGAGKDFFVLQALADSAVGAADVILDFDSVDQIDLRPIDANTGLAADQAFSFIGTGAFTSVAGELRYEFDGTNTHVYGDVDGNGVADFEVLINGAHTLTAARFLL